MVSISALRLTGDQFRVQPFARGSLGSGCPAALVRLSGLDNDMTILLKTAFEQYNEWQFSGLGLRHQKKSMIRLRSGSFGSEKFSEEPFNLKTPEQVLEPNVEISFPTVTLFPPSDGECTNQKDREAKKKTLVCAATGFYPDHVEVAWLVNGQIRERGVAKDPEARRRGLQYAITSRLRVPAPEWLRGGAAFTCVVTFFDGTTYRNFTETISGKDDSSEDHLTRESFLRLTESAKLSYGVLIAKSCVYAVFVAFLLWRFRASSGKSS